MLCACQPVHGTFVAEDDRALPGSFAVDAFGLTLADDDVGESGAVLEDEHGILLARLRLALTDGCCVVVVAAAEPATSERKVQACILEEIISFRRWR